MLTNKETNDDANPTRPVGQTPLVTVRVMSEVFESSESEFAERLVLLAIADRASDDGIAWPTQEELASKARVNVSTVRRVVKRLCDRGELRQGTYQRGKLRLNVYRIVLPYCLSQPIEEDRLPFDLPESLLDYDRSNEAVVVPTTAQMQRLRPLICDIPPTPPYKEEPSLEPPILQGAREEAKTEIRSVYDHWRVARGKTRSNYDKASPARVKKIRDRLKDFTPAELCQAIDGVGRDPWPDRRMHDDITVIFRNREQVDRFLELGSVSPSGRPIATPFDRAMAWADSVGWQYADADVEAELAKFGLTNPEMMNVRARVATERERHERDAA